MRYLKIKTYRTALSLESSLRDVVPGSRGYLGCKFELSEDWRGCSVIAVFSNVAVDEMAVMLDRNASCPIPNEITREATFSVYLIGLSEDFRIESKPIRIKQG